MDAQYLYFTEDAAPKRKTKVWTVRAKRTHLFLGNVMFYSPWRKYVFFPSNGSVFDDDCLQEICAFLKIENDKRKQNED